ncbi:hypothetical protein APHAL10511_007168 [Amanita phalloides]|nr:hypothetical protein APHAL10511_007168 [Amanita phalloides]
MSQWGQYPQQPPFHQQHQQFQNPHIQQPQFQNPHFQQPYNAVNPQPTGFAPPQPQIFQSQHTGFIQAQPTSFIGAPFQTRPVPPLPTQIQQPNQSFRFLNAPPSSSLSSSPSVNTINLTPQQTGFGPRSAAPLASHVTGYVDRSLQLMSNTFMPLNPSAPYSAGGAPLLAPQQQNLQQSFQQQNRDQQMSWALSKEEKKNYDQIFRSWDAQGTGFISGQTALEVFGASGLSKEELARIWGLADKDNRGGLNIAEFHIAMGLIYRRLNGMPIPDLLPPELIPPSARDLDSSVNMVKDLLKYESRSRSPSGLDTPVSRLKNRSFNSTSPSFETGRDATIYKHDDSEPPGGFYQPRSRHINRDDVRSRNEQGVSADLTEMKRKLTNAASMFDRAAEAEAARTAEDEELEKEMDDLKYRVERVSDDLQYVSRGPRSITKDEEKRRLERELLSLMHDRIPELERRIKARDEKRERDKRQWARDRDRTNERFGRYDPKDDSFSSRRHDGLDRPYSRGGYDKDDRDDKYARDYDKRDDDRTPSRRDRSRSNERERELPRTVRSPPIVPASSSREPPTTALPKPSPSPAPPKSMTPGERQAEVQRRIQARMAALGITSQTTTSLDTSVEERLQQEKKEAEEKALAAEKQAEERERLRRERLESEKALRPKTPTVPPPVSTTLPEAKSVPPKATPAVKSKAPAPPPPRRTPVGRSVPPAPPPAPPIPQNPVKPPVVEKPAPVIPQVDPEEEALRSREESLRKQREARAERLRQLEKEEEEAAKREEEEYKARLQALKAKSTAQTTPPISIPEPLSTSTTPQADIQISIPVTSLQSSSSTPPPIPKSTTATMSSEKSTNPFSRFITNKDTTPAASVTGNPWTQAVNNSIIPSPPKSTSPAIKPSYNTAPPSSIDDDWDEIKENESGDESSDDEIARSRTTRANIAEQLFGSMLPRSSSGTASSPVVSPTSPGAGSPPPPPAPSLAASSAPASSSGDVSALMQSIQVGTRLRPTKTVDKSGPPVSGRVLGDLAPPSHINANPAPVHDLPEPSPMVHEDSSKVNNRQSVDWFANRAVDAGLSNSWIDVLPTTIEEEEHVQKFSIPTIQIEQQNIQDDAKDLLSDIDKSTEFRARTLYPFAGDGPDELSFEENVTLVANPSKSGGDWWHGRLIGTGKSGLFPKTFVQVIEPVIAKALYNYSPGNPDELQFLEGDTISIIDRSDEAWWKAERDGVAYNVPATYVEVAEDKKQLDTNAAGFVVQPITASQGIEHAEFIDASVAEDDVDNCSDDSTSDYVSFESEDEADATPAVVERQARERERQMVLEAAGLIVNKSIQPPPVISPYSKEKAAPAVPRRRSVRRGDPYRKDLPPLPDAEPMDHAARLDDAFGRFELYRNQHLSHNRLSMISADSVSLSSPTISSTSSTTLSSTRGLEGQWRYSHFLQFLSGLRVQEQEKKSISTLTISGPISGVSADASRSMSPIFGTSWASLVDPSALEEMPTNERKRQEAIFELIITEAVYVRDLQLIVEIFFASIMSMLSEKEVTVIFANIEDILLINTAFLSSLEERQKDCRLYIDKIGDILYKHIPDMGVYMEYCVNQATAANVLQSLRETNSELAHHLQNIRDNNPAVRNLDLSSYLLAPMQRVTKYPLLIKQILHFTEAEDEQKTINKCLHNAERLLDRINDSVREQEGQERLKLISRNFWIGSGRLDLTAPTQFMGPRQLLKEGLLIKAKSGRRLHGFLCSDILVLTDASMKTLYRLPIPLVHSQASVVSTNKDELTFQINQSYPRDGDKIILKTKPVKEGQAWVEDINKATRNYHQAEEQAFQSHGTLT